MRIILFISFFGITTCFADLDFYRLKLDEFTLAKSNYGMNDTIDVTRKAWLNADSVHMYMFVSGKNHQNTICRIIARNLETKLFEMHFDNHGMAAEFSFSTKRIDPNVIKFVALSMGIAPTEERTGYNYRMGYLRFI